MAYSSQESDMMGSDNLVVVDLALAWRFDVHDVDVGVDLSWDSVPTCVIAEYAVGLDHN